MNPLKTLRRMAVAVKEAVGVTDVTPLVSSTGSGGWFGIVREGFAGAWQRGVVVESTENLLAFSAVYACVDLIAADISKLRIRLVEKKQGVWVETTNPAFSPVLRKPNSYQSRQQFLSAWIVSKLLWGNAFILKERDARNVVVRLHVLDPRCVTIKITADGGIYYTLTSDALQRYGPAIIPASEIIHSRAMCPFHPLVGVGPIFAAGVSATQGRKIQTNSSKFFENMSRPSGQLTSEGEIPDETAERLKRDFEEKFSGTNIGRLLVTGSGLKYESMTMPAEQSQLIEQLGWTGEDCCRPFHVPPYKVGLGDPPTFNNIGQLNQDYYSQCLQAHIEDVEALLDDGLGLDGVTIGTELDLDALLRMDPLGRADVAAKGVVGRYIAPNEARRGENLLPVPGGDEPFRQMQDVPLSTPYAAPAPPAPPAAAPAPAATPAPAPAADAAKQVDELAAQVKQATDQVAAFIERSEGQAREAAAEIARAEERRREEAAAAAVVQREAIEAAIEEAAERRHQDHMAVLTRAQQQIEEERQRLAEERERAIQEQLVAKAAEQLNATTGPGELAQALIEAFTEAARVE